MMYLFNHIFELILKSGYVYLPMMFDAEIWREVEGQPNMQEWLNEKVSWNSEPVIRSDGRSYIRSFSFKSLVKNYQSIDKDIYEHVRKDCLRHCAEVPSLGMDALKGKLQTIILKIMPYFIRKGRGLERKQFNDDEMLDLIGSRVEIPRRYFDQADEVLDSSPLVRRLDHLRQLTPTTEPLPDGRVNGETLRRWFEQALAAEIIHHEKVRIEQEMQDRERISDTKRYHLAIYLYLAETGTFELDGFGFERIKSRDDYLIYKRTGQYILKDYYDRSYLFPDCRVAVSTNGPLRPLVIESYKHPFLIGHAPRQEICVRGYNWPDEFNADNIIGVLEEGINALLYGYDSRRRNGYHSLDPTQFYVKTIEFLDYRI